MFLQKNSDIQSGTPTFKGKEVILGSSLCNISLLQSDSVLELDFKPKVVYFLLSE